MKTIKSHNIRDNTCVILKYNGNEREYIALWNHKPDRYRPVYEFTSPYVTNNGDYDSSEIGNFGFHRGCSFARKATKEEQQHLHNFLKEHNISIPKIKNSSYSIW